MMTPPPLAQYRQRIDYIPSYGDYVVWSGWFSTWHGLVIDYDKKTDNVSVIFAGVPYLLFTMDEKDHPKETVVIPLLKLRQAPNGLYAIAQNDGKATVWYI